MCAWRMDTETENGVGDGIRMRKFHGCWPVFQVWSREIAAVVFCGFYQKCQDCVMST